MIRPDHLNNLNVNLSQQLKQPAKVLGWLVQIESRIQAHWVFSPGVSNAVGDGFSRNPKDRDLARSQEADDVGLPKTLGEAFRAATLASGRAHVCDVPIKRLFQVDHSTAAQVRAFINNRSVVSVQPKAQLCEKKTIRIVDADSLWGRDLKFETVPPPVALDAQVQRWYPTTTSDRKAVLLPAARWHEKFPIMPDSL